MIKYTSFKKSQKLEKLVTSFYYKNSTKITVALLFVNTPLTQLLEIHGLVGLRV